MTTDGANIAVGAVTPAGTGIVAGSASGTPVVRIVDATGLVVADWLTYPPQTNGGTSVAVANLDGVGNAEIVTVPYTGQLRVRAFNIDGTPFISTVTGLAGRLRGAIRGTGAASGFRVAAADIDLDDRREIIVIADLRVEASVRLRARWHDGSRMAGRAVPVPADRRVARCHGCHGSLCATLRMLGTMTHDRHDASLVAPAAQRCSSLTFALVALGAATGSAALPRRLTDHGGQACSVASPAVNGTASLVVFESTCDFTGGNVDGNREIFQVDRSGTIAQLTSTLGCTNANPASNFSGGAVAFDSDCDFGANPDRNVEIFTATAAVVTQLTASANCTNLLPAINSSGSLIAFDSDCDLTGDNLDGSVEIFRSSATGVVEQITDDRSLTGCASINAYTDASGDVVAFESDCDLVGGNGAQVNEIFESRPGDGIVRRTNSQGDSCVNATPVLTSDGQSLAFASDCDLLGENPDSGSEIYTISDDVTAQITSDAGTKGCESLTPSIAKHSGADRVVFSGYCNPTGDNADGSFEVFSIVDGAIDQLTAGTGCWSVGPKMPASADVTVYVSNCDLDGQGNAGSPELYLEGVCVCGAPVSAAQPTATDALYALQTGVGAQACALCECDVNGDGRVAATDALLILAKATGQNVTLSCP